VLFVRSKRLLWVQHQPLRHLPPRHGPTDRPLTPTCRHATRSRTGLRDLVLGLRELVGLLGRTSGGKSDRFDAFVLCELARTDSHRFRVLVPDGDQTKALRALTRAREDPAPGSRWLTSCAPNSSASGRARR
jgi:hypothetical protein